MCSPLGSRLPASPNPLSEQQSEDSQPASATVVCRGWIAARPGPVPDPKKTPSPEQKSPEHPENRISLSAKTKDWIQHLSFWRHGSCRSAGQTFSAAFLWPPEVGLRKSCRVLLPPYSGFRNSVWHSGHKIFGFMRRWSLLFS